MLQFSASSDGSVHANMFAKSRCCLQFTPVRILLKKLLQNALFMALLRFLRLVSTQENYPWIGKDKEMFFVLKSLVPTQSSQDKEKCIVRSNTRIIFRSAN